MRPLTHKKLIDFHKNIATAHNGINGFFRFNVTELLGKFRTGIQTPVLMLEAHSGEMESTTKNVTNFNNRSISFLLLDFGGKINEFDKQDDVIDNLENIGLDICSYLVEQDKTRDSILYGMFDVNSFKMEKVGPIYDNMHGWNVLYNLKNNEKMCFEPDKWTFPVV